ncbi:hypothetical protein H4R24_004178 [Coemansia sp. RSA 988]|nr:hypothetical protein H4R24_004178 [Coemansia sp. RSA 988]
MSSANNRQMEKTASMKSQSPWKPGERVCSLEELYRAADIRLSRNVSIGKYYKELEETLTKAKKRLMEQDLQYAYVFYLRYATVVVKHLPNQPDYNNPEFAKSKERASKSAKKALTTLERLQPILQQRYDEYVKYLTSLPRPKATVSTYSTKWGMSDRRLSTSFDGVSSGRVHDGSDALQNAAQKEKHANREGADGLGEFSLANALQGLDLGKKKSSRASVRANGAHTRVAPKEEVLIEYPSVLSTSRTTLAPIAPAASIPPATAPPHDYHTSQSLLGAYPKFTIPEPQLQIQAEQPALPPRPDYTNGSPSGAPNHSISPSPVSVSASPVSPSYATGFHSAPVPLQKPLPPQPLQPLPELQPPPRGDDETTQPAVPPKPREYHDGAAAESATEKFMPPCFIGSNQHSLTEGGARMRPIQVPEGIFEEFIDIASNNTRKNLETCGVLCGRQVPGQDALIMTTLIIPKQRATSDTCTTEHEEELFAEQMDRDLITLGWIHTHPTQTCFMSSLDLHTQCSYQLMLPEAIAIVCSPSYQPRFGIFRLTDPSGIDTIQNCKEKSAFHPHDDSKVIYTNASDGSHVLLANYDFDIVDIRGVNSFYKN